MKEPEAKRVKREQNMLPHGTRQHSSSASDTSVIMSSIESGNTRIGATSNGRYFSSILIPEQAVPSSTDVPTSSSEDSQDDSHSDSDNSSIPKSDCEASGIRNVLLRGASNPSRREHVTNRAPKTRPETRSHARHIMAQSTSDSDTSQAGTIQSDEARLLRDEARNLNRRTEAMLADVTLMKKKVDEGLTANKELEKSIHEVPKDIEE